MLLNSNEIVVNAHPVRYHGIEYHDAFVTIQQNRTRRRIYNGWYFEDTGTHIYVSTYMSHIFQHKKKTRQFIVNTVTKEWKPYKIVTVEKHIPEKIKKDASIKKPDNLYR